MFELQGSNFLLKFDAIYSFKDNIKIGAPTNGFVTITIESNLYKGISELEIDIKDLQLFFSEVINLWTTLNKGETIIKEPYGYNQYIRIKSFEGKFEITGDIKSADDEGSFKLKFSEVLDQSYFNNFIRQIEKFKIYDYLR